MNIITETKELIIKDDLNDKESKTAVIRIFNEYFAKALRNHLPADNVYVNELQLNSNQTFGAKVVIQDAEDLSPQEAFLITFRGIPAGKKYPARPCDVTFLGQLI